MGRRPSFGNGGAISDVHQVSSIHFPSSKKTEEQLKAFHPEEAEIPSP